MRLLSRASALARLQTAIVERALRAAQPSLDITCLTRASAGDQDQTSPLWKLPTKGAFTADLSQALRSGAADIVVHSYKDLPIEMPDGSTIAGALPRADARDLLLMRESAVAARPNPLRVLSSSPRRAWLLGDAVPPLLPWPVHAVEAIPVRGNIETRVRKLIEGDADALVVAKAALDRLLSAGEAFASEAAALRGHLRDCRWMVMPMREFPWAPAQGAIAMEISTGRADIKDLLDAVVCRETTAAVEDERKILAAHGGGCHQALGAAVLTRPFGQVISVRDRSSGTSCWQLRATRPQFPKVSAHQVWPPVDGMAAERQPVTVAPPESDGWWIARAEALPEHWTPARDTLVWAAGSQTWRRLAARGVWVAGCADGLGEQPQVDTLAGREVVWTRLTHDGVRDEGALATYSVSVSLPDDLPSRSHFFWMSGELFKTAIARWPSLRSAWHASGPGRTRDTIIGALGDTSRYGVWLDRASWEQDVCL